MINVTTETDLNVLSLEKFRISVFTVDGNYNNECM